MTSPVVYWRKQSALANSIGKFGKIISWTVIRVSPANFTDQVPYPVCLVQLTDGSTITAQLVDYGPHHLLVGQKVVCILRKTFTPGPHEVVPYCLKVKPV